MSTSADRIPFELPEGRPLGVGIVGLSAERGWGAVAHVPVIRALPQFELRGLVGSTPERAAAAAAAHAVPFSTASVAELADRDDIDLIVIATGVPQHAGQITDALRPGKLIYSEWPLARTTAEARELAAAVDAAGARAAVGLQARSVPEVLHAKALIAGGAIGTVESVSLVGSGGAWGPTTHAKYLHDADSGATLVRIPFGHTFDGLEWILGDDVTDPFGRAALLHPESVLETTGERFHRTAHDQFAVGGTLASGGTFSSHYRGRGGLPTGLLLEIVGSEGTLRFAGPFGHLQFGGARLSLAAHGEEPQPVEAPEELWAALPASIERGSRPASVAHAYTRWLADLADDGHRVPDFHDAVRLHEQLDAIEAATGVVASADV
jgi:predicted dehydrogenase